MALFARQRTDSKLMGTLPFTLFAGSSLPLGFNPGWIMLAVGLFVFVYTLQAARTGRMSSTRRNFLG